MIQGLAVDAHPLLELDAFEVRFRAPLGEAAAGLTLPELLERPAPELHQVPEAEVKTAVRDLLRHGGFKPSGRSKPASEYLQRAIPEGRLGSINPVVDVCNAASFRFALPISVVDLDLCQGALRVGIAEEGARYVFNTGGQVIDVGGLLGLRDAVGWCANAVKDSQRTKTSDRTTRVGVLVWGTHVLEGRAGLCGRWFREALGDAAEVVEDA